MSGTAYFCTINQQKGTMKKRLTTILLMIVMATVTAHAQKYTVRRNNSMQQTDSIVFDKTSHLYKAGRCIELSGRYDIASWGMAAASGICYIASFNSKGNGTALKTIGLAFALGSLATRVYSITYKIGAGKELKMSAGTVQITF